MGPEMHAHIWMMVVNLQDRFAGARSLAYTYDTHDRAAFLCGTVYQSRLRNFPCEMNTWGFAATQPDMTKPNNRLLSGFPQVIHRSCVPLVTSGTVIPVCAYNIQTGETQSPHSAFLGIVLTLALVFYFMLIQV